MKVQFFLCTKKEKKTCFLYLNFLLEKRKKKEESISPYGFFSFLEDSKKQKTIFFKVCQNSSVEEQETENLCVVCSIQTFGKKKKKVSIV
jgi:hypothetical protein